MQQAIVLFGAQRWGKEYVANMVIAAGAALIWPNEWQRAQSFERVAVVAMDEYIAEEALAVAEQLGVPFYPTESHFITFHKHRLRRLWNQLAQIQPHLMPVPFEWLPAGEASMAPRAFPVMIKPDAYSGSVGVRLVINTDQLPPELQRLRQVLQAEQARYTGEFSLCQDILIELAIPRKGLPN
jgi:D-alanine-D-alanine ligase-like ATP-grasp enzyme